jgi:hypothetical protein
MTRWSKALLQTSMLLLPFGCSIGQSDPKLGQQAAALLLQRYETVVGASSKLLARLKPDPSHDARGKALGLPFIYLRGGLNAVGPNAMATLESGSDTILTGARDFVRPAGLGMVSARTCTIAILSPGAVQTLGREFRNLKVVVMDGRPVWTWSIAPSEGYKTEHTFYAAVVANSFFVLANDREDFREVANALAKGTVQTGLPGGRDLTLLRAHGYWAYRAIRRTEGADTSASGLDGLPASAVALELFTESEDGKLVFNFLAPGDRSGSPPAGLPSSDAIRFQRGGSGVWQAEISLTTPQTTNAVYQILWYLGYGVLL